MNHAERWAAQLPAASRAFAASEAGEYWPAILERAGRREAAEAWACANTIGEVGAHALARFARMRDNDPELSKLAFQVATTGAPQTVLEVLATLGLGFDPDVDAVARDAIANVRETRDAAVALATEVWADNLGDHRVLGWQYVAGQSAWTDIAAYRVDRVALLPPEVKRADCRRLLAAAVDNPTYLAAFRDDDESYILSDLPILERLIEQGALANVEDAEASETRRGMMAWWLNDRRAAAALSPERARIRRDEEGLDENVMLVSAVHAMDDTAQLDGIARTHVAEILEILGSLFDRERAGERVRYLRDNEAAITRSLSDVANPVVKPTYQLVRLLNVVAEFADQPNERGRIDTILAALEPYNEAIHIEERARDWAIIAFARLGDLDRVSTFELRSASGLALREYVLAARRANDPRLANQIFDGAFSRRLSMTDLLYLVPAIEPNSDILHDGLRAARAELATLHVGF